MPQMLATIGRFIVNLDRFEFALRTETVDDGVQYELTFDGQNLQRLLLTGKEAELFEAFINQRYPESK